METQTKMRQGAVRLRHIKLHSIMHSHFRIRQSVRVYGQASVTENYQTSLWKTDYQD